MRRLVISVAMLGACSGGPGSAGPDGAPEAPDARAEPTNVTIDALGAQFILYRDGTGPWQTPEPIAPDRYGLRVTDDYQLVIACSDDTGFDALLLAWTLSEGTRQFAFCAKKDPSVTTVEVTGDMIQPGQVTMGDFDRSTTGPWSFALDVTPGLHDLIGVSDDGILIRRDQRVVAATTVDPIDVVQDGAPLRAVPLTVDGVAANETVTTELILLTGNDGASISAAGAMALTPPDSVLEGGDVRILIVAAETETSRREATAGFDGTGAVFSLLPPLTGVTFAEEDERIAASWGTVPVFTNLQLMLSSSDGSRFSSQTVLASDAWIEATGATELSFDTSAPGYDPAWRIDLDGPYTRSFRVFSPAGPIGYSSASVEHVNGAISSRSPPCAAAPSRRVQLAPTALPHLPCARP